MPAACALLLTACAASKPYDNPSLSIKPVLLPPPRALLKDCREGVDLTPYFETGLTLAEQEAFWMEDRYSLAECARSKKAVVVYYRDRDKKVGGTK